MPPAVPVVMTPGFFFAKDKAGTINMSTAASRYFGPKKTF